MNKEGSDYIEGVLIRLRRKYGKDEYIGALLKEIKNRDVEIGKLKSEVDYLNIELTKGADDPTRKGYKKEVNKMALVELQKTELYKAMATSNRKKSEEIDELKKLRDSLLSKLYANE